MCLLLLSSGLGLKGALRSVRLYLEQYVKDSSKYKADTQEGLKPLIEVALSFSQLAKFTGREKPTVIT